MKIGAIKKIADGSFTGEIKTLAFYAKIRMVSTDTTSRNAPDYRVYAGEFELGAAWNKNTKGGDPYISLKLDCPSLAKAIYVAAFPAKTQPESFDVLWNREEAK